MKARKNDPCPCGSGKRYEHCCFKKNFDKVAPQKKRAFFTRDDGSQISEIVIRIDSLPTHNKNGLVPDITPEQMMDLCLDEIFSILEKEKVGMHLDLVDKVLLDMDIIPSFTYQQISNRMRNDSRFHVMYEQICGLKGTDPLALMGERIRNQNNWN